jgi:hypothetical protein
VRRCLSYQLVRDVLACAVSAIALIWAGAVAVRRAPSAAPPRINGAYELTGSGPNIVTGRAVVSAQHVRITGTMTDAAGNDIPFTAPDLSIDRSTYRFTGSGTLGSTMASVCGRLDPDDATVKKCRIVGTFAATDGNAGRFTGGHQ